MKAIVLSDLHLDSSGPATDEVFVSFLEWLVARAHSGEGPWRLIVLGDLFELLHVPVDLDPLTALEAVAADHRCAFAALGEVAASAIRVDLVPGNHDSELLDPALQERLRVLVADAVGTSAERLRSNFRIQPWFVLVPGVLYAEHGSQYHPLNAVADPLAPFGRWSRRLPPGAVLDLGLRELKDGARTRALPRLLPAIMRATARRRWQDEATAISLQSHAQQTGLSPDAVAELRGLSGDAPLALVGNLSAALLRRSNYVESRQQHAAVAIHEILAREGQAVPLYVFGHTHRAAQRTLPAAQTSLRWLNPGAWANGTYRFAQVEDHSGAVDARLCRWDTAARSAFPLETNDSFLSSDCGAQEDEPESRVSPIGSGSADPAATP